MVGIPKFVNSAIPNSQGSECIRFSLSVDNENTRCGMNGKTKNIKLKITREISKGDGWDERDEGVYSVNEFP